MPSTVHEILAIRAARHKAGVMADACAHKGTPAPSLSGQTRYRHRTLSAQGVALGITVAIHLCLVAVLICEWHRATPAAEPDHLTVMMLPPLPPDRPAMRLRPNVSAAKPRAKVTAVEPPPVIVKLPTVPEHGASLPIKPAPPDGGRENNLAAISQAYRSAITARIEAARHYPRLALLEGYQGAGAILFRLDRDGNLLDVMVETSTGRHRLDRAAVKLVERAAPYPAIPAELPDELAITMPIRFLITDANPRMAAR